MEKDIQEILLTEEQIKSLSHRVTDLENQLP